MANNPPKYTNNGTYGCVMRPGVSCKLQKPNDMNTVSKLFKTTSSAKEEVAMHNKIIDQIDPNGDFTVKLVENCDIEKQLFPEKEIDRCKNFDYSEKTRKKMPQIVYEYGGFDLTNAARRFSFEEIFQAMKRAFKGLVIMESKQYAHVDIKPDNIVYNNETGKLSIIDFGLASKFNKLYVKDNDYIFRHPYPYYPPEFQALGEFFNMGNVAFDQNVTKQSLRFMQNMRNINDLILSRGRNYFWSDPKFLHEWDSIGNPNVKEFYEFLKTEKPLDKKLAQNFVNRLDVYMLGVSLLELLYLCSLHGTSNIAKNPAFFLATIKLISKMVYFTPSLRITPKQAYEEYKKIVSMILVVPPSPTKPSPIKVKRVPSVKKVRGKKRTSCPPGKVLNPATGRCVKEKPEKVKECPPGKVKNPLTGRCIKVKKESHKTKPPCPPGKIRNPETGRCKNIPEPKKPKVCPSGKKINPVTGRCIKVQKSKPPCPSGKVRNPETGRCINAK